MEKTHLPVLMNEVIENMNVLPGERYLDATFGEGGHTEALLKAGAGEVVALDRDREAIHRYLASGPLAQDPRLKILWGEFSGVKALVGDTTFRGALVDLGPSTRQLLEGKRGFSFTNEGPLDMRMNPERGEALSAYLEKVEPNELAKKFEDLADIRNGMGITQRILTAHRLGKLRSTADLAKLMGERRGGKHPATQVFMALRMIVNRELEEIEQGLPAIFDRLVPGGRLAVISFHSIEDRLVKMMFRKMCGRCVCREYICRCEKLAVARPIIRKALAASSQELKENPRSRSAKLRCIEKLG